MKSQNDTLCASPFALVLLLGVTALEQREVTDMASRGESLPHTHTTPIFALCGLITPGARATHGSRISKQSSHVTGLYSMCCLLYLLRLYPSEFRSGG